MALEFGLLASRGSDFHTPDESHTDLGALPDLPGQLTPVWDGAAAPRAACLRPEPRQRPCWGCA